VCLGSGGLVARDEERVLGGKTKPEEVGRKLVRRLAPRGLPGLHKPMCEWFMGLKGLVPREGRYVD